MQVGCLSCGSVDGFERNTVPDCCDFAGLKLWGQAHQFGAFKTAFDADISKLGLYLEKIASQLYSSCCMDAHAKRSGMLEDKVRKLVGAARFAQNRELNALTLFLHLNCCSPNIKSASIE